MAPPAPRFAYLLLTHRAPATVDDLVARLLELSPSAEVVVHHDAAAGAVPEGGRSSGRYHLVERLGVRWGDWSMVEATHRLLRFAHRELDPDWMVLLSGEHRPTADLATWERAVADARPDVYSPAERLPDRLRFGRPDGESQLYLARCRHRYVAPGRPRSEAAHRAVGGLAKLAAGLGPLVALEYAHRRQAWALGRRRPLGPVTGWTLYRGSQWIALNRRAAAAALAVDPAVTAWFRPSWIPDETYFQTVLRQVPDLVVSDRPTTFVLPTPDRPTPGWMQLAVEDLPAVWDSGTPFARKVDRETRPEVVEAIDTAVDRGRRAVPTGPVP